MELNKVYLGDCLVVMKDFPDNSVDSICCDPPYELGFMGKSWDNTGIAYNVEMWKQCLRVLKPGGHLLSFGGTRTYHRMACAIEDAGFEVRDMVSWIYGSGFPKSLNIGKAVDKLQGNERELVQRTRIDGKGTGYADSTFATSPNLKRSDTPISDEAKQWEGWGTALKPACEPCVLARKPLSEKTVALNVLKWGTGGINIELSRIKSECNLQGNDLCDIIEVCQLNHLNLSVNSAEKQRFQEDTTNLIKKLCSVLVNVDTLILEKALGKLREDISIMDILCCEGMWEENMSIYLNTDLSGKGQTEKYLEVLKSTISMVKEMITEWKISSSLVSLLIESLLIQVRKQNTTLQGQGRFPSNLIHDGSDEVLEVFPNSKAGKNKKEKGTGGIWAKGTNLPIGPEYGDNGSASRFFYCAKTSRSERNKGCEGLDEKIGENGNKWTDQDYRRGDEVPTTARKNFHPTVKPKALMKYLITLITPKGGTVLDPFAGSGSTLVAAKDLGFNYIGIEREEDYIKIINARLK